MHYTTNYNSAKQFVGQFGVPRLPGCGDQRPGTANNLENFSVVKPNASKNIIYVYTADEGSHGLHRWRIKNP
jgi:hypothetical protein